MREVDVRMHQRWAGGQPWERNRATGLEVMVLVLRIGGNMIMQKDLRM